MATTYNTKGGWKLSSEKVKDSDVFVQLTIEEVNRLRRIVNRGLNPAAELDMGDYRFGEVLATKLIDAKYATAKQETIFDNA